MAVRDWDPTPYPDPRKKRGMQPSVQTDDGRVTVVAPRVRNWALNLQEQGNNNRAQVSAGPFRGPGIVKRLVGDMVQIYTAGGRSPAFGIYWQTTPYAADLHNQGDVAITGQPVWELSTTIGDDNRSASSFNGFPRAIGQSQFDNGQWPIDYPIIANEFYLVCLLSSFNAGGASTFHGYLTVYENIDPIDVGRYVG